MSIDQIRPLCLDSLIDFTSARYTTSQQQYTAAGNCLISLNPYAGSDSDPLKKTVDQALRSGVATQGQQVFVVCGQSGAGKTTSIRIILDHLLAISTGASSSSTSTTPLEDTLSRADPLIDAFGNAATAANPDSSRYGKSLTVYLGTSDLVIRGAKLAAFNLETSRITRSTVQGERNFHVFYQLLAGCSPQELLQLYLDRDPSQYAYLRTTARTCPDAESAAWVVTLSGMVAIGMTQEQISALLHCLAAILHIGNVADAATPRCDRLKHLAWVGALLGFKSEEVEPLATMDDDAKVGRYTRALARGLYSQLFTDLIDRTNAMLGTSPVEKAFAFTTVDLPGFEDLAKDPDEPSALPRNSDEQLVINYSCEKLHAEFVRSIIRQMESKAIDDGCALPSGDRSHMEQELHCIDVFEKDGGVGIISRLEDFIHQRSKASGGGGTAPTLSKSLEMTLAPFLSGTASGSGRRRKGRPVFQIPDPSRDSFTIRHYAGSVDYLAAGMADRISSTQESAILGLLAKANGAPGTSSKKPLTALRQCQKQWLALSNLLNDNRPYWILCVSPNTTGSPWTFEEATVRCQFEALGIRRLIQLVQDGLSNKLSFEEFYLLFHHLESPATISLDARERVHRILTTVDSTTLCYSVGRDSVRLNAPTLDHLTSSAERARHEREHAQQERADADRLMKKCIAASPGVQGDLELSLEEPAVADQVMRGCLIDQDSAGGNLTVSAVAAGEDGRGFVPKVMAAGVEEGKKRTGHEKGSSAEQAGRQRAEQTRLRLEREERAYRAAKDTYRGFAARQWSG